ncbi:8-amino-7-oxononanoate synthase [Stakelama pacifica]|uniref:8-amino-7-oxononanoate synthase n=1 Tax=Stakelama pacifica TaxID=517720 RepID=A0A4R6FJP7_9SPHN|nr:8-amino-7-oxononanoate synthase [Stakelama pacifica]TDN81699.1 8-amino-7-oxononanoate synthase [Stakelama pacifica]GGO96300.1 8-amino-7-oxononanoate synthase [Stakelama pacifica]
MTLLSRYHDHLAALSANARRRSLIPRRGIDFASNDYLAMAKDARLADAARAALDRGVATGSGGSRLLRGNDPEHEALETEAARLFQSEAALFVSSGFAANAAALTTLPQNGDHVFADSLIHASMHEGLGLARCGHSLIAHNDADAFADAITRWRAGGGTGTPWIAVESLYSMDGDRAPLESLAAIAKANDAMLLVDEAHAAGVFGDGGRGLAADLAPADNLIRLVTLGKAYGAEGALLLLPAVLKDMMVNRARGVIFTTAPSPLMAAVARTAIATVAADAKRRARLFALARHASAVLGPLGATISGSQILPLIIGGDAEAMAAAAAVQAAGFDVRGIRPPTVPAGTARLRISITCNVGEAEIDTLADAIRKALA